VGNASTRPPHQREGAGIVNVKPGDFAKVVPPHFRAGVLVTVKEACAPTDFAMLCATDPEWSEARDVWLCALLTGSRGIEIGAGTAYLLPGDKAWIADAYLRRITPKADDTTEDAAERLPAPSEAAPA
jgi:hypothetical protein